MKSRLAAALFVALALAGSLRAGPTLEQIIADPQLWPAEVTVPAATRGTVLKDGQPAGVMLVGAGKRLTVTGIAADGVTGKLGGTTVKVPVEKTNLLAGGEGPAVAHNPPAAPAVSTAPAATGGGMTTVSLRESAAEQQAALAEVMKAGEAAPLTPMQRQLSSKLVRFEGGKLAGINTDRTLNGVKYYGIYFSASWCGPCRQFTPGFVDAYRELKQKYPQFEVVFVSADRSAGDMAGYMKEDHMPWPALKYELVQGSTLMRYAGPGIPCLVLVDANGKVLSDSFNGDDYLGPQKVLNDTRRILARGL